MSRQKKVVRKSRFAPPAVDVGALLKKYPTHREHILRVRNKPDKLHSLSTRLIARDIKNLRALRDGQKIQTNRFPSFSNIMKLLGLGKKGKL